MTRARVVNRMPQFIDAMQFRAERGMLSVLLAGSSNAAARTPRESSVLVNSRFERVETSLDRVVGVVGYTADYALAVHEAAGKLLGQNVPRPSGKGVFWGPSGEPEFLRKGFEDAEPDIRRIVTGALRV